MVAPAILVSKHRTSPTQLGYLSGGTTFTQIGTGITASETWASPQNGFPSNRGVWFKGCYFTLAGVSSVWTVQVFDPIGLQMFDPAGLSVAANSYPTCSGLFVTRSANPVMFFVAQAVNNRLWLFTTTDGRYWGSTQLSGVFGPIEGLNRCILYRNQLYALCGQVNAAWAFLIIDPTTLTLSTFDFATFGWASSGSGNFQGSLCVFKNRIFLIRIVASGGSNFNFYEFTGGTFVLRNTLHATNVSGAFYGSADSFLFPVGSTKMVAICSTDTGNSQATRGTRAFDITPSGPVNFTVSEVTSTLIPTALRRTADGGGAGVPAETNRWTGYVDNDFNTTPGSPQAYIWLMSDFASGTYTYYEYVDSLTELAPGTTGPNQGFALPYATSGGGDRTYASVGLKAIVTNVVPSPSPGRVRVTARVYGDVKPAAAVTGGYTPTDFYGRRPSCVAGTTGALPAVTYANGAGGVGATLTRVGNGALPLQDNVSLTSLQRLLVKNQAAALQNGIYEVTSLGDGSNPFVLTRATDYDDFSTATGIAPTTWTRITSGDTLANSMWTLELSDTGALTVGATGLPFVQMDAGGTPANRRLRIWYSVNETPNMLQATLAGTPTQAIPAAPTFATTAPVVTRNVNALETLVADGATEYTFDWDATADALQSGQAIHIMARAGTA